MDDAYWYAREAIRRDPDYTSSYNTLGVVYNRSGHLAEAAKTFRHVLAREPGNTHVLSNLAPVLANLGRLEESRELERRLAQLQPDPPFASFNRGLAAMREGDYRTAQGPLRARSGARPLLPRVPLLAGARPIPPRARTRKRGSTWCSRWRTARRARTTIPTPRNSSASSRRAFITSRLLRLELLPAREEPREFLLDGGVARVERARVRRAVLV